VLGKYPQISDSIIQSGVRMSWDASKDWVREEDLLALLKPLRGAIDDVWNQVVVLQLIEKCWSKPDGIRQPLRRIHGALFGTIGKCQFRQQEGFVEDFGGIITTKVAEIEARLDEIERLCTAFIERFVSASFEHQAFALSYALGAIIRVHPFADGNGRTARMFLQLALRSWGLPAVQIPKARNDARWAQAVSAAVAGNVDALQAQLLERLCRATAAGTSRPFD